MVKYTHLNRSSEQLMADLVSKLSKAGKDKNTRPAGVKDMTSTGDLVWDREDGTTQSIRDVDTDLEEARLAVAELRDVTMPELSDQLSDAQTELQGKLDALDKRVDDLVVDGGGAGNFTTYSQNEPTGEGTGEGDTWWRVVNGEVLGQWRWDGTAWVAVTLTDAVIAGLDLSKITSGGNLSEVVANKMFTDLFTANKITAQEIAAGSITTEKIAAEGIVADVIQGGSFTGESFVGGTFTGGAFKTSDALPGQVEFADDAYHNSWDGVDRPGFRIVPEDTTNIATMPGVGAWAGGASLDGGTDTSGTHSHMRVSPDVLLMRSQRADGAYGLVQAAPEATFIRAADKDGAKGDVQAAPEAALMGATGTDGASGVLQVGPDATYIRSKNSTGATLTAVELNKTMAQVYAPGGKLYADAKETYMFTSAGGYNRYLAVDKDGVWVKTNKSGSWAWYNLEETAQDSGWKNLPLLSGISSVAKPRYRNKGGIIFVDGVVTVSGGVGTGWSNIGTMPAGSRPEREVLRSGVTSDPFSIILRVNAAGALTAKVQSLKGSSAFTGNLHLSPMFFVAA